jgi:hypothetical protein
VASKQLAKQYEAINIDQIEDLHDDMTDMMETADEVLHSCCKDVRLCFSNKCSTMLYDNSVKTT